MKRVLSWLQSMRMHFRASALACSSSGPPHTMKMSGRAAAANAIQEAGAWLLQHPLLHCGCPV
jgi:hypothetical protein